MLKQIAKPSITFTGFLITFCGAVLFSTKAIIVKKAFSASSVDALSLLTLRMIFSLPFYLFAAFFISRKSSNVKLTFRQWIFTLFIGLLGYYISSYLDFLGLQYISAGLERLILFLYPTFAVLINSFLFGQKIEKNQRIALLLTYIGICIAFGGEMRIDSDNQHFFLGSFLVFLCAVTYSFYLVGSGKMIVQTGAAKFTAYAMLGATMGVFIHFIIKGNNTLFQQGNLVWWYGLLLAIVATVIPSFLLSYGLKSIGSNNVAIISSIGPVSTIVQAHYFLGERIFAAQVVATILVIVGLLLLGIKNK